MKMIRAHKWIQQVAGHKINTQKPTAFLYISNKQSKGKLRKQLHFHSNIKKNETVRNKLNWKGTRLVHWKPQNIVERNYLEDLGKWKVCCAHGLEDVILSRWQYFPKQFTDLLQFLSKLQEAVFAAMGKPILKFIQNCRAP